MKNTKLGTLLLFLIAASFAAAQEYTYTFTAPIGAISCAHVQPYQQWYQNLVENSTPPYPKPLQPGNFQMPAYPNHSYPVANGICPYMGGFVSPNGITANFQVWQIRTSAGQVIYLSNLVWTVPTVYPAEGQPAAFSMDATITTVCNAECVTANGTLHLEGQWAFQWKSFQTYRWVYVEKAWTNTSPVTIEGQSTVAILD